VRSINLPSNPFRLLQRSQYLLHAPSGSACYPIAGTSGVERLIVAACVLCHRDSRQLLIAGADLRKQVPTQPPRHKSWHCWWDRRYGGDICEPPTGSLGEALFSCEILFRRTYGSV